MSVYNLQHNFYVPNPQDLTKSIISINNFNKNCTAEKSVYWIYEIFGQCVLSNLEMIGFYFGLLSIACWMCSTIPQLVLNCKSGNADKALSFYFLFFWLAGDTCNMVGCILASQLPIQIITGCYYILMDMIMIIQYLYLSKSRASRNSRRSRPGSSRERRDSTDSFLDNDSVPILMMFVPFINLSSSKLSDFWAFAAAGADSEDPNSSNGPLTTVEQAERAFQNKNAAIGYSLGIISCIFYMVSRFPQITRNFKRGSTAGVSISMFLLAIAGNFMYGTSVLMSRHADVPFSDYLKLHLPWLVGSYGTMALDLTIVCQCLYLKNPSHNRLGYREVDDEDNDETILRESE